MGTHPPPRVRPSPGRTPLLRRWGRSHCGCPDSSGFRLGARGAFPGAAVEASVEVQLSPQVSGWSPAGPRELGVASLPPSVWAPGPRATWKQLGRPRSLPVVHPSCFVSEHSAGSGRDAGSRGVLATCRRIWGIGAPSPLRGWGAGRARVSFSQRRVTGHSQACCEGRLAAPAAIPGAAPPTRPGGGALCPQARGGLHSGILGETETLLFVTALLTRVPSTRVCPASCFLF